MAKAIATCTCKTCGAKFERIICKNNRADAESAKDWTEQNITECPDCYAARNAKKTASMGLPEIVGKSDKQIKYASDLRTKYAISHKEEIEQISALYKFAFGENQDEAKAQAASAGMTVEDAFKHTVEACELEKAYVCIVEANASAIINALR